jgi:hypothetical protein
MLLTKFDVVNKNIDFFTQLARFSSQNGSIFIKTSIR